MPQTGTTADAMGVIERAWNQGDLAAIDELVHPDYVRHTSTGDLRGPEAFKERIAAVRAAFPDFHCAIEETLTEGNRRAARFTNTGTHLGDFFGLPSTGRRVEFTNAIIVHLRDGQLYEEWEFLDTAALLRQLTEPLTEPEAQAAPASTAR